MKKIVCDHCGRQHRWSRKKGSLQPQRFCQFSRKSGFLPQLWRLCSEARLRSTHKQYFFN
ncbi:unnamed protein product [Amoebophrya sp. A25]|nr:unnamed protein product [Amoebophrya sp. A25]|eukprot:GSA25T00019464001.1